jgi:V4R domain
MGGRILDSYEVDLAAGQIVFAGVDKQIVGSEFVEILFRELREAMGEEEGQQAMYDMHYRAMEEQLADMDFHNIFPGFCASLFEAPADPELLGSGPSLAHLYGEMESMLIRLLFNESGWGSPVFDSMPVPSEIAVHNSAEPEWMPSSDKSICYGLAGYLAAFVSFIAGERYLAREIKCAATGSPDCVFEVEKV